MGVITHSSHIGRKDRQIISINRQLWGAAYCSVQLLFAPFFRVEATGIHFIPKNEGFLLLPKHQCWQDIPLLGATAGRPLYYVAKYELFYHPWVSRFLRALGGIPLNRERPIQTRWSFRAAVDVLEKGGGLVLFPEGTYFQKSLGRGRGGMLRFILNRVQVPLIPVGIQYQAGRRPRKVSIRFGPPIKNLLSSKVLDQVMADIASLSGLSSRNLET